MMLELNIQNTFGVLTASGTLGRKISKALIGALTTSGVVSSIKRFIVSLAGTLASSGVIIGFVKRFRVLTDFVGRTLSDIIGRNLSDDNDEFRELK